MNFGLYSYAFYFGGVFVLHGVTNSLSGKVYTAGDVQTIMFGIVFSCFSIGMIAPSFSVIKQGKINAGKALNIIEREPRINKNEGRGIRLD